MTAADPALDTLMLPFASGQLAWPPAGGALFLHAREGWPLHRQPLPGLVCEQDFKPAAEALQRAGLPVHRHDAGTRMGWLKANVAMALQSEDADEFRAYVRGLDLRD